MSLRRHPGTNAPTPVGAVVRGLVAGAVGTAAMDALLFIRYRRDGGTTPFTEWELSSGLKSWEDAPAPAHVGKRLVEGLFDVELPARSVPLVNNATHWGFGMLSGAGYGLVAPRFPTRASAAGLAFGGSIWAGGYVVLPAAKLYEPIWMSRRSLTTSAHISCTGSSRQPHGDWPDHAVSRGPLKAGPRLSNGGGVSVGQSREPPKRSSSSRKTFKMSRKMLVAIRTGPLSVSWRRRLKSTIVNAPKIPSPASA
jgi:hypothetical protein